MSVRSRFKTNTAGNNQNYWGLVVQKGPGDPSGNFRVTDQSHAGHKGWYTVDVPKREPNPQKMPSVVQKSIKYDSSNRFIPKTKPGTIQRSYAHANEIISGMATSHPNYNPAVSDGGNRHLQNFRGGGDTGVKEETLYPSGTNIKQEERSITRNNNLITEDIKVKTEPGTTDGVDDLEQNFVIVPKPKSPNDDVVVKSEESVVKDIDMTPPAEEVSGVKTIAPFEYDIIEKKFWPPLNPNPLVIQEDDDAKALRETAESYGGILELFRSLTEAPINDEPMLPPPTDTIATIHDTVQDTVNTVPPGQPIGGPMNVDQTTVTTPPVITKNAPGAPPPVPTVDEPMEPAKSTLAIEAAPPVKPTVSEPVESIKGQYPTGGPIVEDITGTEGTDVAQPIPPANQIPEGLSDQQVLQLLGLFQERGFVDHIFQLYQLHPGLRKVMQNSRPFGPTLPAPTETSRSVVAGRKGIRDIGESMVGKRRPYLIKPAGKIPLKALPSSITKPSAVYPPNPATSNNVSAPSTSMSTPVPTRVQPSRAAKAARKSVAEAVQKKAPKKAPTRVQPARAAKKAVAAAIPKVSAKKTSVKAAPTRVQPKRAAKTKSVKEKTTVGEASIMTPEGEAGITTPGVRRSTRLAAKNKKSG